MKFTPNDEFNKDPVPYLDEARSDDGWQGHTTNESIGSLKTQISAEIGRLGGFITQFMEGEFEINGQTRPGFQIRYQVFRPDGSTFEGKADVAGLPWRDPYGGNKAHKSYKSGVVNKRLQSLAMALYNVRETLIGMRNLSKLSPGFAPLLPWLLRPGTDQTLGQTWNIGSNLLPSPNENGEIVDAQFVVLTEKE